MLVFVFVLVLLGNVEARAVVHMSPLLRRVHSHGGRQQLGPDGHVRERKGDILTEGKCSVYKMVFTLRKIISSRNRVV